MKVELPRPLAASLLLGLLLGLAGLTVAAALADLWSSEEERDTKAAFVSRGLRTLPRPADARADERPLAVEADTETLAAARVDALLRSTVEDAGGSVLSSRAEVKHDEAEVAGRIEVQAVIEARNDALQAVLLRLEGGAPAMLVDSLSVEPGEPVQGGGGETPLRAGLTLSAYWKAPPKRTD